MKSKFLSLLFFLFLLNPIESVYAQSFQELVPKASKVSYYTYQLDGLNSYSKLCPNGCGIKENEVRRFFNNNKDKYQLIEVHSTRGYVNRVYFINLKEQSEYISSGLADKSQVFHEAKTLLEWINVRKEHPDFRIRSTSYDNIIGELKKENMSVQDFWKIFPEYSEDNSFKESLLKTSANRNDILYYLSIYNDKTGAKDFVLKNNLLAMNIHEFIQIFEDKESAKRYALQHELAGLDIKEFISVFDDKESAKRYALLNNLAELSMKEFISVFNDKESLKDWVFNNKPEGAIQDVCGIFGEVIAGYYLEQLNIIEINDLITYIQCAKNHEKATDIICKRLIDLSGAKPTGLWIQRMISPVSGVFTLQGYIEHKTKGIEYANKALPFINNSQCVSKIEKEISKTEFEINNYYSQIENAREEYKRNFSQYMEKMCLQCSFDEDKLKHAYNETIDGPLYKYTKQHPGKLEMRNGDDYYFYLDENGGWYITGIVYPTFFDSLEKLISHFLEDCRKRYCN